MILGDIEGLFVIRTNALAAAGGEPKATAKQEADMAPAWQHHVLLVLGVLPSVPPWARARVRQGSPARSATHTLPCLHGDTTGRSGCLSSAESRAEPEVLEHGDVVSHQGAGLASSLGQASLQ